MFRRVGCVTAAVVAAAVLVGCSGEQLHTLSSSATGSPSRTSHRAESPSRSPSTSGAPTPSRPASRQLPRTVRPVAYQAVLSGRRIYVFIGPPDGRPGTMRLRVSTLRGRQFVTIGPHVPHGFYPDSLFVLDARHLWFTAFWDGGGRERLYRTSDAGNTWHWRPVASHSMAAGSTDALWFTDPDHGWLTDIQPTAPNAMLFATSDGGRHWHVTADTAHRHLTRTLPTLGPVEFEPNNTTAWLAAPSYYSATALYVTRNAGHSWRVALSARHHSFAMPGVYGTRVLEPVSWCTGQTTRVQVYVSADDGIHWTREPGVDVGAEPDSAYGGKDCQPVAAAEPSANVAWVAAVANGRRLAVRNTCDQGRHWHIARPPNLRVEFEPEISATDCRHALLDVRNLHGATRLYLTSDGGATWQPVDKRVTQ